MSSILILASVALCALSQNDCRYGEFELHDDVCMFDCDSNNNNYIPVWELGFGTIRERCERVDHAARIYGCTIDDLVWPSGDSCYCPYCSCETVSTDVDIYELNSYKDGGPSKDCFSCACVNGAWLDSAIDRSFFVWNCEELLSADDAFEWEDFQCPPTTCTDSHNNTRSTNEEWFEDKSDGVECNEFCYCSPSQGTACATGWDNIMSSDVLLPAFREQCGSNSYTNGCYNMDTQSYDASRLYATQTGPYCYSCPRCSCPTGKSVGDTWYHEYQQQYHIEDGTARCALCECKDDGNGGDYTDCDIYIGSSYAIGTKTCNDSSSTTITCHSANSASPLKSTLSTSTCEVDEGYQGFCTWNYDPDDDGDSSYSWGCDDNDIFCEAYASDGDCIYINTTVTYSDCYNEMYEETVTQYVKCCDPTTDGDNCNYETIYTDSCTRSAEYETLIQDYYACFYDYNNYLEEYLCDDYVTDFTCDAIQVIYQHQATCFCGIYSGLYNQVSDTTGANLQAELDAQFSSFTQWNDIFGCDIDISCDLSTGTVTGAGTLNPSPSPSYSPTQPPVISNECIPECDESTEVCLSNGKCQTKVSDTSCTSTAQCIATDGENFVCETENNGGFCYYDECVKSGSCEDGYACASSSDSQNGIDYQSGVCEEIGGVPISSVQGWSVFGVMLIGVIVTFTE